MIFYETERLIAREVRLSDEDDYFVMKSDPRITHAYGMEPYSKERSLDKLQRVINNEGIEAYNVAICLKDTDQLIGSICLWNLEPENHKGELGYEFAFEYTNHGYGPESVKGFMEYMKNTYGYTTFTGCPWEKNYPSNRLLQKLGFTPTRSFEEDGMILNDYEISL